VARKRDRAVLDNGYADRTTISFSMRIRGLLTRRERELGVDEDSGLNLRICCDYGSYAE
jgi:hypothetical protein